MKVLLFVQSTTHVGSVAKGINALVGKDGAKPTLNQGENRLLETATQELGSSDAVIAPFRLSGAHHALMLPAERELAENLFRRRDGIKALAATATLAQGMNLPADIVFIVGDERFDKQTEHFSPLEAHEVLNAAGRAGRAGHVAQGAVVVLPHTLVEFDPKTNRIGAKWAHLQEAVFSRADQCLIVQDPVQTVIDRVHAAATEDSTPESEAEVQYFLRRIPPGGVDDVEAPQRFLRRTFAAWHAKHGNEEERFEREIIEILERRNAIVPASEAPTWRDELAHRTGIEVSLVDELHHYLEDKKAAAILTDTEQLVRWFFGWVGADVRRVDAIVGHRMPADLRREFDTTDLFGGALPHAVWSWMSGAPLVTLNAVLGGNAASPGTALKARKFVLRVIPELSFAAGLVTQIKRKQLDEIDDSEMPLALATFGFCVRDGAPSPEIAALRATNSAERWSRQKVISVWDDIKSATPPRNDTESFKRTKARVTAGLQEFRKAAL